MTFSVIYLVVRCLLGGMMVINRRRVPKDAELLVAGVRWCIAGATYPGRAEHSIQAGSSEGPTSRMQDGPDRQRR